MKITKREGARQSARFSVSVNRRQSERVESALTYLERHLDKTASQVVIDLILSTAKNEGWKFDSTKEHE